MAHNLYGRYGNTHGKTSQRNRRTTSRTTPQTGQTNTCKTSGTQSFLETRKVHIRTTKNRISGSQCQPRNSTNGRHEDRKGEEMDRPTQCQRSSQILRIYWILSIFYPRLFQESLPTPILNTQYDTMALGTRTTDSI